MGVSDFAFLHSHRKFSDATEKKKLQYCAWENLFTDIYGNDFTVINRSSIDRFSIPGLLLRL